MLPGVWYRCAQVFGTEALRCLVQIFRCVAQILSVGVKGFGQWRHREEWEMLNVRAFGSL